MRRKIGRVGRFGILGVVSVLVLSIASSGDAAIRRVNPSSPGNGPGAAFDWSDAYTTLQGALADASSGDQIWVHRGTYTVANEGSSFVLKSGVAVIGGFDANDLAVSDRDPDPENTILSGDLGGADPDNADHVVKIPNTNPFQLPAQTSSNFAERANLDGFKITGAYGNGGGSGQDGAGIWAEPAGSTTPTNAMIRNCIIEGNYAANNGGGFSGYGNTNVTFRRCFIRENVAAGPFGGGLQSEGNLTLLDCTIENNTCVNEGGGIGYYGGTALKAICCTFSGNEASHGGAIAIKDGATIITLHNSVFLNNTATFAGGAVLFDGSGITPNMINCTMKGNTAGFFGGAWFSSSISGTATIKNSIIWGNSAGTDGNEIWHDSGTLIVCASNVRAKNTGAAVFGTLTLCDPDTNIGNNTTADDPDFVSSTDLRLQCGSPCINAGLDSNMPADSQDVDEVPGNDGQKTRDRELKQRVIGSDVDGTNIDMGAFEFGSECPADRCGPGGHGVPDNRVNVDDLLEVINGWGTCPTPPLPCLGDIAPTPCPNGTVNVDDLLLIINSWGNCSCCGDNHPFPCNCTGLPPSMPFNDVNDCMEWCSENFEPYGDKWLDCVNGCIELYEP